MRPPKSHVQYLDLTSLPIFHHTWVNECDQNQNDTVISRYITLALETQKDMNNDGINIPYEAAIFDTTLSANAL